MEPSDEGKQVSEEQKEESKCSREKGSGSSKNSGKNPNLDDNERNQDVVEQQQHQGQLPVSCSSSIPISRPDSWGVLTALSDKAKARPQGAHIMLYNSEHVLGRLVKDPACQFDSLNVSAKHCTIFRKRFKADDSCIPLHGTEPVSGDRWLVYIKDSSSNGTFINCQRLKRDSPEARIKDGDIISLVNVPEHENAFAFVYQELQPTTSAHKVKRKSVNGIQCVSESISGDTKRLKGLGVGGPDGPVSLADIRRLQRSNEELRNQLEGHVLTIEKLRSESRAVTARHDAEMNKLKETLSAAFQDQIQSLQHELEKRIGEIENYTSLFSQQHNKLEDLNRSLEAATQSRKDADEVIDSQKLEIAELKEQLEEEHNQRRHDRDKAEDDLKAAVERVRFEASEEFRRQAECAARQERDHLEMINKLREADEENRSLIEGLRHKLDDLRESLVVAERTNRSLDLRLNDEVASLAIARKKIEEKEKDLELRLKELEGEKAEKEEALAKLSALELEMETTIQNLSLEKQRLQGARERIVLRETQLRAFHSTAEEIALLQRKQQEQLQAMMKVLEDGDDETNMPEGNLQDRKSSMDTQNHGLHHQGAAEGSGRSNHNSRTSNEEKKEATYDADSQMTANNSNAYNEESTSGMAKDEAADTQIDDVDRTKGVELVIVRDKPINHVHVQSEAAYTQVTLNETQLLGCGKDECAQRKLLFGYTQLMESDTNGKSKYVNETQVFGTDKDHNVHDGEAMKITEGCEQQTLLLEDENYFERQSDQGDGGFHTIPVTEEDVNGAHERVEEGKSEHAQFNTLDLMTSEVAGSWALSTPGSFNCKNGGWSQTEEREGGEAQKDEDTHGLEQVIETDADSEGQTDEEDGNEDK